MSKLPLSRRPPPEDLLPEELIAAVAGSSAVRDRVASCSLPELAERSVEELRRNGVRPAAAYRLACALELGRRVGQRRLVRGETLGTCQAIFEVYRGRLGHLRFEQFLTIHLDARNRVLREHLVSQGTLTSSLVHPREVFRAAIREAAAAVVLVHNHPSGDPEPSPEDRDITRRLEAAGELIGIRVADHVVVAEGGYVSFLERGYLAPR
jgi:DNA repair protein RadC